MSQHEVMEAFISAIATEVARRIPKPEEVTAEDFRSNIETMLQQSDWFKQMVKEQVDTWIPDKPDIENEVHDAAKEWLSNNFDIGDYKSDIESVVEDAIGDVDFSDKIEEALDDADVDRKVEREVEEQVAPVLEQVEGIQKRVIAMERWITAVRELPLLNEEKA